MARAFYSYDDRYMVTGTIRRDGYSAFGANNPYAWFPSGGIAWSFTNEDFFQKYAHIMNSGKLRVSYGKNGNRYWKILTKHLPIFIRGVVKCKVISLLQVTYI